MSGSLPVDLIERISLEAAEPEGDWERARYADEYERDLPAARVDDLYGRGLEFDPNYAPEQPAACTLAYAIYVFPLAGLELEPVLHLAWETPPLSSEVLWLALADVTAGSWHWLAIDGMGPYEIANLEQFLEPAGQLMLLVVLSGTEKATLRMVRIGGNVPPRANLLVDGEITPRGDVLLANAIDPRWVDPDGEVTAYRFDLNGDGDYETETGTTHYVRDYYYPPYYPHPPYTVGVEVEDDLGAISQDQTTFEINRACIEVLTSTWSDGVELAADGTGRLHLLSLTWDWSSDRCLTYLTNTDAPSWKAEEIVPSSSVQTIDLALDTSDKPWIGAFLYDEAFTHVFFSREATGWEEHPEMCLSYGFGMPEWLHLAFDSQNRLHMGYGASGDFEWTPPLVYCVYESGSWTMRIDAEPAWRWLHMEVAPDDTAWFLFGKMIFPPGGDYFGLLQLGHATEDSWEHETVSLLGPCALAMTSAGELRYIRSYEWGVIDNRSGSVTDEPGYERLEYTADSEDGLHAVLADNGYGWQGSQAYRLAYSHRRPSEWIYDYEELWVSRLRKVKDVSLVVKPNGDPAIAAVLEPVNDSILPWEEFTEVVMIYP